MNCWVDNSPFLVMKHPDGYYRSEPNPIYQASLEWFVDPMYRDTFGGKVWYPFRAFTCRPMPTELSFLDHKMEKCSILDNLEPEQRALVENRMKGNHHD